MIKNIIFIKVFIFFIEIVLVKTECSCQVGQLEEIEKLNKDIERVRIEYPNGLYKYSDKLSYSSNVECQSVAMYILNKNYGVDFNKKCRICTQNGWSDLSNCNINRCDRDYLSGEFLLQTIYSKQVPNEQKLFIPGQVLAVFKYSTENVCKVCQSNGEWSIKPDSSLCKKLVRINSNISCKYNDLKNLEYKQLEYVRINIQTQDGLKIHSRNIQDNKLATNTIVVYQRYLSGLASVYRLQDTTKSYYPSNPFTKKFCRYCENGVWSEIESCVTLKCDKDLLTGNPQFLLVNNKIKALEQQTFFNPYSVIAVYFFGNDKFCKQCHENGEWSKYSLAELCKVQPYNPSNNKELSTTKNPSLNRDRDLEEMYKKEATCSLINLNKIEREFSNLTRFLFVAPDRRQSLDPEYDAKIPSRTLSIYQSLNKNSSKRYCSICINGIWSKISDQCTTDSSLYFCERKNLTEPGIFRMNDNRQASEAQNLFEPGTVMVVYDLSETTKLCKICELKKENAIWSKYAEASLCNWGIVYSKGVERSQNVLKPSVSCKLNDLELIEDKEYTRENIQNWNAKNFIDSEEIQEYSMAVYQSNSQDPSKSNLKWCRKCKDGKWDMEYFPCPVEFSIKKCDPIKIRGVNYFVYVSDGSKLTDDEKNYLMFPGKVIAVYEFGVQKYCKACNEDGNWSSYPQYQICNKINWIFK